MNEFSITPFRGPHLLLLLLTVTAVLFILLLLRGKPEARRSRYLIGVCFFNLALFAGYKLSLSMDATYIHAYYPNGFSIFNELPLHLCNINLFLIPLGVWKRNRSIMGFSFFVAPLGALMALLFPEPLFSGFSLLMPRIFGYYVTHALLVSPFVGRLDDICEDGVGLVGDIVRMYRTYDYKTQVLAASIRNTKHIIECVEVGADVATCPLSAIKGLLNHPLTDSGLKKFLEDYKKVNG